MARREKGENERKMLFLQPPQTSVLWESAEKQHVQQRQQQVNVVHRMVYK